LCGGELPLPAHRPHTGWTPQEIAWVRRLLGLGLSAERVGRLVGVSRESIRTALKRRVGAS
jgi:hypothetical protein